MEACSLEMLPMTAQKKYKHVIGLSGIKIQINDLMQDCSNSSGVTAVLHQAIELMSVTRHDMHIFNCFYNLFYLKLFQLLLSLGIF